MPYYCDGFAIPTSYKFGQTHKSFVVKPQPNGQSAWQSGGGGGQALQLTSVI